jgi:hypothetical protein
VRDFNDRGDIFQSARVNGPIQPREDGARLGGS